MLCACACAHGGKRSHLPGPADADAAGADPSHNIADPSASDVMRYAFQIQNGNECSWAEGSSTEISIQFTHHST